MIEQLIDLPELKRVEMFTAGVEPDNVASVRTLTKAGLRPLEIEPDLAGIVYYVRRRGNEPVSATGGPHEASTRWAPSIGRPDR